MTTLETLKTAHGPRGSGAQLEEADGGALWAATFWPRADVAGICRVSYGHVFVAEGAGHWPRLISKDGKMYLYRQTQASGRTALHYFETTPREAQP